MFERFTDRARRVVVLAQEEARDLRHNYIGTEHLLLGLLREGTGLGAQALGSLGLDLEGTRDQVVGRVGTGNESPKGHIPFTPRCKNVLELSLREALRLKHGYIGTEHLMLALVREGEGVAAQILLTHVDGGLQRVQKVMEELLGAKISDKLEEGIEQIARRHAEAGRSPSAGPTDEIVRRLEAIEARLTAIERTLRARGEEAS